MFSIVYTSTMQFQGKSWALNKREEYVGGPGVGAGKKGSMEKGGYVCPTFNNEDTFSKNT